MGACQRETAGGSQEVEEAMSEKWWKDCTDVHRLRSAVDNAAKALTQKQKLIEDLERRLKLAQIALGRDLEVEP